MYSYEDRIRAVKLYIKLGQRTGATLRRLGVAHSRSRPAVSNDNPYSESLFKTLKYRPQLQLKPFACLLSARRWVTELVHWYNGAHRHRSIGFVTPDQGHAGLDQALLNARAQVYEKARQANPLRWSRQVRDWSYVDTVHLNPDTPQNKETQTIQKQPDSPPFGDIYLDNFWLQDQRHDAN